MQQQEEEVDQQRKELYKIFGKETGIGKELFGLYNARDKPNLKYPKPKQKTEEQLEKEREKPKKPCPQKTEIEYPKQEAPKGPTYHPIDFVMRRKPEAVIQKEIEEYYAGRKFYRPLIKGKDRKKIIEELQKVFKYRRGGLPKAAELPEVDIKQEGAFLKDSETTSNAMKRLPRKDFMYLKPDNQSDTTTLQGDPLIELDVLFQQIAKEIEERQEFLADVQHLNEPKLKQKIKDEIIERVAELQKVQELKKHYS